MTKSTTDHRETSVDQANQNTVWEALAASLLFALGTILVATGVITGASLSFQMFSSINPLALLGSLTVVAVATGVMIVGMLVLIGVIGSFVWPSVYGYANEYTIAGAAALTGVAVAIGAVTLGFAAPLNLLSSELPGSTDSLTAIATVAVPVSLLLGRLVHPNQQPGSNRSRYGSSVQNEDRRAGVAIGTEESHLYEPDSDMRWTGEGEAPDSKQAPSANPDPQPTGMDAGESEGGSMDWGSNYNDFEYDWRNETDVSMSDVGGMSGLKKELSRDVIKPLTSRRDKAEAFDIPLPNLLFYGPPGTGKSFIAKALATEIGLPFAKLSGSDVTSKWINESASMISQLFSEAETIADSEGGAVVFLDELDSVLKARDSASRHDEDQKIVNEFLNHLQETDEYNILFIGATNRMDVLDEAGIRAGRIDKKFHIGKPDLEAREAIIKAQLAERPHALTDQHIKRLAFQTDGQVAADLKSVIVDAARHSAFERGGEEIRWTDINSIDPSISECSSSL